MNNKILNDFLKLKNIKCESDPLNRLNLTDSQRQVLKNLIESNKNQHNYKTGSWASSDINKFIKESNLDINKNDLKEILNDYSSLKSSRRKILEYFTIIALFSTIVMFIFFLYDRFSGANNSKNKKPTENSTPLIKSEKRKKNLNSTHTTAKPDTINRNLSITNRDRTEKKVLTK